ncbi:MAG TPA: ABC transporter permease [Candidatus Eisenbacteria bacterium]|nr:ABC transporter permease [Candidatus Eisenbacteria bacterium]
MTAARRFARDRWALAGFVFLALLVVVAVAAPLVVGRVLHASPYRLGMMDKVKEGGRLVDVVSDGGIPIGPSASYPLGADLIGRDVLSRLIYGARVSLLVSTMGTLLAVLLGLLVGLLAGFYRGTVDTILSRFVDAMMAIPILLLAIALASVLPQGNVWTVVLILGLVNWTYLARIVRGEVLSLREKEFVEAARALGANDSVILARHLVPNLVGPLLVFGTLSMAGNILLESALSFLGVGIQAPTPSWGNMIQEGMAFYSVAWWVVLFPGIAILLTVVSLNLVGDGLRDALVPGSQERIGL